MKSHDNGCRCHPCITHASMMQSAADKMAYELCKTTVGHPMNCQCESDKALREYLKSKSAMPRIIVAGEEQAKGLARLSSVWKWLTSRTTRRRGIAPNDPGERPGATTNKDTNAK